ncbi:MAG: T9SS type A sorting domain-containing protein [Saprospiraceae bacterium]
MTIKINYLAVVLFLSFSLSGLAQEGISISGGNGSGDGGTVAYSVGQVFYSPSSSSTGSVIPGVQQAYNITTVGLDELPNLDLSVFPNPTINQLILKVEAFQNEKLTYQLFDLEGKLLGQQKINDAQTSIQTSELPSGSYFLNIIQETKKIKTFKIIKN